MRHILLIVALYSGMAQSNSCDTALSACKVLVDAQSDQITHLKADMKQLEKKLDAETAPLIPWWGWSALGVLIGGVIATRVMER